VDFVGLVEKREYVLEGFPLGFRDTERRTGIREADVSVNLFWIVHTGEDNGGFPVIPDPLKPPRGGRKRGVRALENPHGFVRQTVGNANVPDTILRGAGAWALA
jgi:hypothetical protein